jgi:hypothetical protein
MPGVLPVGVGQALISPPIALLDPVLDENGPYAAGDHTITDFLTTTAHGLLPAGTWPIGGTYGVVIVPTTIPATWGYDIGYDSGGPIGAEGYVYENRFAQVVIMHGAISGGFITVEVVNCHLVQTFVPTPFIPLGADRFGLNVSPGVAVDVYFMCLLA